MPQIILDAFKIVRFELRKAWSCEIVHGEEVWRVRIWLRKKQKYAAQPDRKMRKSPNIFFCPSTKQFVQVSPSKENQNPADRTCNLQQIALNLCVSDNLPAHKSQLLPLVGVLPLISTRPPSP